MNANFFKDCGIVDGFVLFPRGTICPIFEAFPVSYSAHQVKVFATDDIDVDNALVLEGEAVYTSSFDGAIVVALSPVVTPTPDIFHSACSSLQVTICYIYLYNLLPKTDKDLSCPKVCKTNVLSGKKSLPEFLNAFFYHIFVRHEGRFLC